MVTDDSRDIPRPGDGQARPVSARVGLDTTGHNIANANTDGYSRQRVKLRASYPLNFPGPFVTLKPGQVGTGVEVVSIQRIRSAFIEAQIHREGGIRHVCHMNDVFRASRTSSASRVTTPLVR